MGPNRHADLLFNIVSSRSQQRSTIITTNRPFAEWGEAFPNASCVVALVDRLVHNAEIVAIDGDSYPDFRNSAHDSTNLTAIRPEKWRISGLWVSRTACSADLPP